MPKLLSLNSLYLILPCIVPDFIALFVRSQFITTRRPSDSNTAALLSYLTVSVVYGALVLPRGFVDPALLQQSMWAWFGLVFVGPVVFGLFLGITIQKGLVRRLLNWFGLYPVHATPTAWDWKFGGREEQWVRVTLRDGTCLAGFYGSQSFTSSTPGERDMYIQWVYDIDDTGTWSSTNERGVLIAAGEISTIEFWAYTPQEETHE